jgi:AraC-like DNA-binding protein
MLKIEIICLEQPDVIVLQRPYAVLLVSSGVGVLSVETEQVELVPGRVFFLKKNLQVSLDGDLLIGHLIAFDKVMLHAFLLYFVSHRDKGLYHPDVRLPYADLQLDALLFVLDVIGQLNQEIEEGTPPFIFMHVLFVLLRQVNREVELVSTLPADKERVLVDLLILIEANYKTSRKTSFYAAKLGLTDRELNSFAHEVFGKRFFDVLMERLLVDADMLLRDKNMAIKEIAYELGFTSQSNFTTYYQRYKGYTPGAFRGGSAN